MSYRVTASDGAARAGVLATAHGEVPTPAFMPVGTKATVKAVDPDELGALGAAIVLGNSYHLHFRPGPDLIAELGGLHRFMAWDGPILTDSGGFQVFSLRHTILAVGDEGTVGRLDESACGVAAAVGRGGSGPTRDGRLNLKNARYLRDPAPLQEGCSCPACARFSRAYIRHLVNQQELLGHRLLSLHNLRFLLDLTAGARAAIERGEFAAHKCDAAARLGTATEEEAVRVI